MSNPRDLPNHSPYDEDNQKEYTDQDTYQDDQPEYLDDQDYDHSDQLDEDYHTREAQRLPRPQWTDNPQEDNYQDAQVDGSYEDTQPENTSQYVQEDVDYVEPDSSQVEDTDNHDRKDSQQDNSHSDSNHLGSSSHKESNWPEFLKPKQNQLFYAFVSMVVAWTTGIGLILPAYYLFLLDDKVEKDKASKVIHWVALVVPLFFVFVFIIAALVAAMTGQPTPGVPFHF